MWKNKISGVDHLWKRQLSLYLWWERFFVFFFVKNWITRIGAMELFVQVPTSSQSSLHVLLPLQTSHAWVKNIDISKSGFLNTDTYFLILHWWRFSYCPTSLASVRQSSHAKRNKSSDLCEPIVWSRSSSCWRPLTLSATIEAPEV